MYENIAMAEGPLELTAQLRSISGIVRIDGRFLIVVLA